MKKIFSNILLILIITLVGCNATVDDLSGYSDSDIAAIVKGEEITIGDLRFLYPDDKILEYLDGTIKAKLVELEVKEMNLDVSQKLQEMKDNIESIKNVYIEESNNREFINTQSTKLGMEKEEYYAKFLEKNHEMGVYLTTYVEEKIGELNDFSEVSVEEYNEIANELLDELVKENEQEIQRLVK